MKCAVAMGSGGMIYTPSVIKSGSSIQNLIEGIHRHTDIGTAWRFLKPIFIFFKIRNVS
jgi:hypothetical protein